ncbi:putative aldehyde dehydrogenase YwdH [Paenibacillus sp. J31TS4]|uniref:aldehyde dehydrogenase n=1 Tax=Paenibacillus sp. J31TS4 TaxID=2807195 RepID=UPI001B0D1D49|nr:aldehyde dehydrogenase [Paenibacillus sp. J31TS4]GIP37161.1 putative aldehyde dehydrogenase YwdH [Paenibacillus sp. J31TS4]
MTSNPGFIPSLFDKQKAFFSGGATRSVEERLRRLAALKEAIRSKEQQILGALHRDLSKSEQEAYATEIGILYEEIRYAAKRLPQWAKPRRVKTALTHVGSRGWIVPEPYGTVLILAPWNYPFQLAIAPLIGAIAAGNTAIVKPSELTPSVSAVVAEVLAAAFPPDYVAVVQGGVQTSTELLELPFDYIFFTGSVPVGKLVMEAAAKHLTPVTLELGGKSPCIVHEDADPALAAKRIAFGKFTNAGQTCIAPDYVLAHRALKDKLVEELARSIRSFYGDRPLEHPAYGSIVSDRHYARLAAFLEDGTLATGGERDPAARRIAPTVLTGVTEEMPVMQEEIFGPILPVLEYETVDQAVRFVRSRPKPLALYLFTRDKRVEREVLGRLSFGGGTVNDTLMHIATPYLPFGGVGESGMGSYHGQGSFETFSHHKSILKQPVRFDLPFRYPGAKNGLKWMRRFLK